MKVLLAALTLLALALSIAPAAAADDEGPYLGRCVADETADPGALVQACSLLLRDTYVTGLYSEYRALLLLRRGRAYERLSKYAKAAMDYRAAAQIAPGWVEAWKTLALLYGKAGQPDAAMTALDAMVKTNGANAPILNAACWVRAELNLQIAVARADCDEALRLKPGDAPTLDSRCLVHYRLGELSAAIADCTDALTAEPGLSTSFYIRGLAENAIGQTDAGKTDIDHATEQFPDIAKWYAQYGVVPIAR